MLFDHVKTREDIEEYLTQYRQEWTDLQLLEDQIHVIASGSSMSVVRFRGRVPGEASDPVPKQVEVILELRAQQERIRERLIEGSGDVFSATYRALTEAYYKRIAEEGNR